jgi:hypothetical protein
MGLDDGVLESLRETAELTGSDRDAVAVDVDHDCPFQYHEDLVAIPMGVKSLIVPLRVSVVEPQLKPIRLPRHRAPRFVTCQQSGVIRQLAMVESTDLGHRATLPDRA